ncbi:MAG: MBL fold metallo-hydrolase [Thermoplasmata archaeon]|nr:MBL fold metallo-hydrolase [Thermoplasmata archaeon]NIS11845.1 MBL fold metallo-hydrolase [Thermoplasmata archaeon]NIS19735.1 MBL fold metallo-hydrolase [Thermoplasmata archaeon]NIT76924.1 MBL fold metallo-hydrolase [Thermoplasmata archaeon]NIU48846.1 MBL fold metallo-hydrolase [Thermoplasmata archaeon]
MPFERVLEGIYQVGGTGLSGPGDCCCYLIEAGGGRSVLVDAGLGSDPVALSSNIEETGHRVRDISALVLTHCHIDHIGGAPAIIDASECDVVSHEADASAIEEGDGRRTAARAYGVNSPQIEVTRMVTADGGILEYGEAHIVAIHTPGHTPGSITLQMTVEGCNLLFAQDVHGPFFRDFGSDVPAWRRSMERLIAIGPDVLLEGHYGVIRPRGPAVQFIRDMLAQDMRLQ